MTDTRSRLLRRVAGDIEALYYDQTGYRGLGTCASIAALVCEGLAQIGLPSQVKVVTLRWWHDGDSLGNGRTPTLTLPHVVVLPEGWLLDPTWGSQVSEDPRVDIERGTPMILRSEKLPVGTIYGPFTFQWLPRHDPEMERQVAGCIESVPQEWWARARTVAEESKLAVDAEVPWHVALLEDG